MSEWRIPLSDLNYGSEEEDAVLRVVRSRWISMGPEVEAFEHSVAELQRTKHAFAVANGTAALHLALLALGIKRGDEIIQPALNFVAAANMTVAVGVTPVFADIISLDEPTIDPTHVEQLITARTKAIIVMHYGGYLCRMRELLNICRRHKLYLIEDACHAIGAAYDDIAMAGSIGDIGAFSFFSNKNLGIGEGGMVVTGHDYLAERVRLLRSHGMSTLTWDRHKGYATTYDVSVHGYNYRLDDIHAALGREQLRKLRAGNLRRAELTRLYRSLLGDLPGWHIPFVSYDGETACHLMPIVAPDADSRTRAANWLREEKIQTSFHYPCVTGFSAFSPCRDAVVPKSHDFAARVMTLPLHPKLDEASVEYVISTLRHSVNAPH